MSSPSPEGEDFRDRIEAELGLVFNDDRKQKVQETLLERSAALHVSPRRYLEELDGNRGEWEKIAAHLTVPEGYFFRHPDHLRALMEVVLPARMAAHPGQRTLRLLSLGCAGGEEPYTLSMTLLENQEALGDWNYSIRGYDLNPEALRHADRGLYTNWALRATPPASRSRFFEDAGKRHRIRDAVRRHVFFDQCNALQLFRVETAETVDVVFFRNVLIYFSPEAIQSAVSAVAHILAPGGYLFLGPAETLRGLSDDFVLCHTHETFYYRRRDQISALVPYRPVHQSRTAPVAAPVDPSAGYSQPVPEPLDTVWMEQIERSAERVRTLHARHNPVAVSSEVSSDDVVSRPLQRDQVQHLLSLLSAERYGEMIQGIQVLPQDLQHHTDVRLMLGLAHLNRQEIVEAERVCNALLGNDSMNGSAHYLMALCREHMRDAEAAAEYDRLAILLDPSFAMPQLHLALLARRSGDRRTARRAFETANQLLARESSSRLLMFGGGFTRESLRDLCRRELRALGTS